MSGKPRSPRNDALRKRYRVHAKRLGLPCAICAEPIDYGTPSPDPMSFEADHIIPLSKGGADEWGALQPSHRVCNRAKWDKTELDPSGPRSFVTHRAW